MIEIILADENDQLIEANLDGTTFYLHIAWNETAQQFTIGLQTADAVSLIENVVMVTGFPLFYRLRLPFMPLGDFFVIDNKNIDPTRQSFLNGNSHLIYMTEADLKANGALELYGRI